MFYKDQQNENKILFLHFFSRDYCVIGAVDSKLTRPIV